MNDWRLVGNFKDIEGGRFKKRKFESTFQNDHEHCEFCGIKITDLDIEEEHLVEGYVTFANKSNQMKWVCKKCYKDFEKKFEFVEED